MFLMIVSVVIEKNQNTQKPDYDDIENLESEEMRDSIIFMDTIYSL